MKKLHIRDKNCNACCCKGLYIHENCGGKLHERLVDDTVNDGFIHNYRCDKCDTAEYQYGYEDYPIEFSK